MRRWSNWLLSLAALALAAGCRRGPPPPSPEYDEARAIYEKLYASQLDDAYGDPQMNQVVELLKRVSKESAEAEAAQKLLERIDVGKKEFAKQQAESEARRAAMKAGPPPGSSSASLTPSAFPPAEPPAEAQLADAGTPAQDPFAPGAPIATLNREAGGCLILGETTFAEKGTGKAGQVYKVSDSRACQQKVPGLQGQALLVVDGKLYRRVPERVLIMDKVTLPAGGTAAQKPAQPAAAQPPAAQPASAAAPPADSSLDYTGPKPEQPNAPQ
jgi:hypothetical protein